MNIRSGEHWYPQVAEAIVRQGKSFYQAVNELDLGITAQECENILRTKAFQESLRIERNKYYKELAGDPSRNRNAAVGQMVLIVQKLIDEEKYDKAVVAVMALAKLEGWTTDGGNVNIFQDLTAKDLASLRDKFKSQEAKVN